MNYYQLCSDSGYLNVILRKAYIIICKEFISIFDIKDMDQYCLIFKP